MNIERAKLFRVIKLVAAGILMSLVATTAWAGGKHKHHKWEACFETTELMKHACKADTKDDFFEQSAKCLNSDDAEECQLEAKEEYEDERKDCNYQAMGRDDLCERLPDAGPYIMEIDPDNFTGECVLGNPYYPLVVGMVTTFISEEDEGETIIVTVTDETREIEGVEAIVVRDTVYEGLPDVDLNPTGDRIEDTDDYYAIANNCDIWYLGEVSQNFEDGYLDNLDGSFIAGVEDAQAGIIMLGDPMVGDVYRQEFALGDAEDAGEVLSLGTDIIDEEGELVEFDEPAFNCNGGCLMTEDFIANEPDDTEFKYFKPGLGLVAEQLPDGEVILKLVKMEVLP